MAGKEEMRIFVGGLSWDTTDRQLEDAFSRNGKILEAQIMLERDTCPPRGFGFVTFADQRAMENAMKEMHGRELGGQVISVNRAQPKMGADDTGCGYGGGFSSGGRGSYGGQQGALIASSVVARGIGPGNAPQLVVVVGVKSPRSRFGGGGRGDRFGGDRYCDRYMDDRYAGGRYGDRGRVDSRE